MFQITNKNKKWWTVFAMGFVIFILCVDWTVVSLALPAISAYMHTGLSQLQWVLNAYVLTSAMFMIIGGRFADRYGKRFMLLWGILIFTVFVALCGFANNDWMLIMSRAVQGIGAALGLPLSIVLIFQAFPKNQRGLAVGIVSGIAGFSLALGPTVGGFILNWLDWRWVFWVNIPFGIMGFLLTLWVCDKEQIEEKFKIDYISAITLSVALFFITVALNEVQNWGLISWRFVSWFGFGFSLFFLLPVIRRYVSSPLIDFDILRNKVFVLSNFLRLFLQFVFAGVGFVLVLYMQNILGYSPMKTGLLLLFLTVVMGGAAPFSGRMVDAFGAKVLLIVGSILLIVASLLMTRWNLSPSIFMLAVPLFLTGLGVSLMMPGATNVALSSVTDKQKSVATGIYYTVAFSSAAMGIAVTGAILAGQSFAEMHRQLLAHGITLSKAQFYHIAHVATGSHPVSNLTQYIPIRQLKEVTVIVQHAFMHAFVDVVLLYAACATMGLMLAFLVARQGDVSKASSDLEQWIE